jgi:hypothetical protein
MIQIFSKSTQNIFRNPTKASTVEAYKMMNKIMFMSMGWDYVSELRPPTSLLFIPHLQPWWMISAGKNSRSGHQSALWQFYQNREDLEKWMVDFVYEAFLSYL